MFDIGFQEILLIGVLALLVFGPSKLPELGRMFGRAMREFRRASDEFRSTVETNLHINDPDPEPPMASSPAADFAPVEATPTPALPAESASSLETPAMAEDVSTEPFCAQRGSKIFHRRDCAWVKRIPEMDRQYFKALADARDQGFQTCPVCEPWEPR
jgi:sec-independent protein translocase protein TatB